MKQNAEITVSRIRIRAFHGVHPQEQKLGTDFFVTITATAQVDEKAWKDDQLEGTVDYSRFVAIAQREMAVTSQLLEHVAARIAASVLDECPLVEKVSVTLEKQNPPLGVLCDGTSVKIELTR